MKKLQGVTLARFSLLQVEQAIPTSPELQKLEDLHKRIVTCLIIINHQSPLCLGKHVYDGRRVPLKARVTTVARPCER
jgi:hypothetical protein